MIASCHCGAVQLKLAKLPSTLTSCNCSICRRYSALWAYCPPADVQILADDTTGYSKGSKKLVFYHCKHCGCVTHYRPVAGGIDQKIAVNARMLDAELIQRLTVRQFDGADSLSYLD